MARPTKRARRVTRRRYFITVLCILMICTHALSQNPGAPSSIDWETFMQRKVFMTFENAPLPEVLSTIENRAGISFIYRVQIPANYTVTKRFYNISLEEMLTELLEPLGLAHVPGTDGGIGIVPASGRSTLSGVVSNAETGEPIPYGNVFIEQGRIGTTTDEAGGYSPHARGHRGRRIDQSGHAGGADSPAGTQRL